MHRILFIIGLLLSLESLCQPYTSLLSQSSIAILGTSSVHDWKSDAKDFSFSATISDSILSDISGIIHTKSIKSGKGIMDNKTYDALKADDYPEILFSSKKLVGDGGSYSGIAELNIAGNTKSFPISIKSTLSEAPIISGALQLKMSDYGIDPPTAMLGTLTTGDEVTIQFQIKMIYNSN